MRVPARQREQTACVLVLLLVSVSGCAIWEGVEAGVGLRGVGLRKGVVSGRVELVGTGPATNGHGPGAASARGAVLVYLEPVETSPARHRGPIHEVRIRAGRQEPQLALVSPDQPFRFHNLDPIHHEPFSLAAPNDFDVRIGGRETSEVVRLPQRGFVRAFCRLHPSETSALIVSPARHGVAVEDDGSFAIANVRPGSYHVRAAGVDRESAAIEVRVVGRETLAIELELSPRSPR